MTNKKICLNESQVNKVIQFLEQRNQSIFHRDKEIFLFTQDDFYSTVSKVSIFPPYTVYVSETGQKNLEIGSESNFGFNYVSSLKNMFLDAAHKIGLI